MSFDDDYLLYEIALNNLRALAEILEDLPLSASRYDDIREKLETNTKIIEKAKDSHQTVDILRNKIRITKDELEDKITLAEARNSTLTNDLEKRDKVIQELEEKLVELSKKPVSKGAGIVA